MTTLASLTPRHATIGSLIDAADFRGLFVDELGWSNPDRGPTQHTLDGTEYTLTPVASYKGMRVWHCPVVPRRGHQRGLDTLLGKDNAERLIVFADSTHHEWRWPRRGQVSGANAALANHRHTVGEVDLDLVDRLMAIEIRIDEDPTLVELLNRMRAAFDTESETAAVSAARLMNRLYTELEISKVDQETATLLLTRLLFLFFADDTGMWKSKPDLFKTFIAEHTDATMLHLDLSELFDVLNRVENARGDLAVDSPYHVFRYVNGGLFADSMALPALTAAFREGLLDACEFDWGRISPAVFGSMFQTVKDKEARREGGEHYTTEENILKTIGPLFLTELEERFDSAYSDKSRLTKLLNDLGRLRILDPACGCGNFLIVAYKELRSLELRILMRRRDLDLESGIATGGIDRYQRSLDVTQRVQVTLDHFFGIEIDEWPARIAGTAMLLVDHLANQMMEEEFGFAPDRLPIRIAAEIHNKNALRTDWATILPPSASVIVVGNPPFVGRKYRTADQAADMKLVWGKQYNVNLDFVTSWYAKALHYFGEHKGRWAFVSTNSVSQGEPVSSLWAPILDASWRCRFAHRSFKWTTEAKDGAAVHVSIVGFDRASSPKPALWTYPHGPSGVGVEREARNINPYLVDAPRVLVAKPGRPLNAQMPVAALGSMPNDGGHLLVSPAQYDAVAADPVAAKYLRPIVGADELLYGKQRWCLWMVDWDRADEHRSPLLRERLAACRAVRQKSKNPDTVAMADFPHLFWHVSQPETNYLCMPSTVSESRSFFTPAYFEPDVISSNLNYVAADPDGFAFGVLSSSMFMAWMQTVGGRLESRLRFSRSFTYDSFPLPPVGSGNRRAIVEAARGVIAARSGHVGASLAALYGPGMPDDLLEQHIRLDHAVDRVFGLAGEAGLEHRASVLFKSYLRLTALGD